MNLFSVVSIAIVGIIKSDIEEQLAFHVKYRNWKIPILTEWKFIVIVQSDGQTDHDSAAVTRALSRRAVSMREPEPAVQSKDSEKDLYGMEILKMK